MKVKAIECCKCKDIIYSRARHDWRSCSCGDVFIDGGFDYMRVGFKDLPPKGIEVDINKTVPELFQDWSQRKDKYGLIKGVNRCISNN